MVSGAREMCVTADVYINHHVDTEVMTRGWSALDVCRPGREILLQYLSIVRGERETLQ